MQLSEKISQLETDVITAKRLADFWRRQIEAYGEAKATAFYRHLGLNHLEAKSVNWDGLTLSREPSEVEKLCVKSIAQAQEAGKESLLTILLKARTALIDEALKAIKELKPANFHKLILPMPDEYHDELRGQLDKVFDRGRELVMVELAKQKGKSVIAGASYKQSDEDDDELDDLTDLTDSRVANEIQARATSAATRFALLGLTGAALWAAVSRELGEGSTGWLDRVSTGAANKVLNFGRYREMQDRADEIDRYEQSELLDQNTCAPCAADDGKTASNPDDLPGAPNPDCEGGDYCRGFIVAITA